MPEIFVNFFFSGFSLRSLSSFNHIELKSSLMKRYEKAITAMAKQRVTLEVLSYHATAPLEEAVSLSVSV